MSWGVYIQNFFLGLSFFFFFFDWHDILIRQDGVVKIEGGCCLKVTNSRIWIPALPFTGCVTMGTLLL